MELEVFPCRQLAVQRLVLVKVVVRREAFGRGDDTVGNPHRGQISQFELFELVLFLKLDKRFPVERFETTASQSTVPSPPSYAQAPYYDYPY